MKIALRWRCAGAALGLSLLAAQACAQSTSPVRNPLDDPAMVNAGFLQSHPDLRYRYLGIRAQQGERPRKAMTYFRKAAGYADKPSQAMVAEMLWEGLGTPRQRPLAYAWMDLAAERGYPDLLARREVLWHALTPQEQQEAVRIGVDVYADFGDDVALPRIATVLRRERRRATGGRTGYAGNVKIYTTPANFMAGAADSTVALTVLDASRFYDPKFFQPDQYLEWQQLRWQETTASGDVAVGDLEDLKASPPLPAAVHERREHED